MYYMQIDSRSKDKILFLQKPPGTLKFFDRLPDFLQIVTIQIIRMRHEKELPIYYQLVSRKTKSKSYLCPALQKRQDA